MVMSGVVFGRPIGKGGGALSNWFGGKKGWSHVLGRFWGGLQNLWGIDLFWGLRGPGGLGGRRFEKPKVSGKAGFFCHQDASPHGLGANPFGAPQAPGPFPRPPPFSLAAPRLSYYALSPNPPPPQKNGVDDFFGERWVLGERPPGGGFGQKGKRPRGFFWPVAFCELAGGRGPFGKEKGVFGPGGERLSNLSLKGPQ